MFSNMHPLNAMKWLRFTGIVEGVSSILLFFVAMPLKYISGIYLAHKWPTENNSPTEIGIL